MSLLQRHANEREATDRQKMPISGTDCIRRLCVLRLKAHTLVIGVGTIYPYEVIRLHAGCTSACLLRRPGWQLLTALDRQEVMTVRQGALVPYRGQSAQLGWRSTGVGWNSFHMQNSTAAGGSQMMAFSGILASNQAHQPLTTSGSPHLPSCALNR